MNKVLYKILFISIGISFFISATEMDLGEYHNTFFDEYDTYVKTEQVVLEHSTIEYQKHDEWLLFRFVISNYIQAIVLQKLIEPTLSCSNYYTSRLFLRNSMWRI